MEEMRDVKIESKSDKSIEEQTIREDGEWVSTHTIQPQRSH